MRSAGSSFRRGLMLAGLTALCGVAPVEGQGSPLPTRSLTGPNGEYIHDTWRGSRAEFPDLAASALAQDSLGFLLVASPRGIYRFDGDRFLGPWTFPFNGAETIVIDRTGTLWAAGQNVVGLARRFPDGRSEAVHLPHDPHPVGPVSGLTAGADGTVFFAVTEGIFVSRGGESVALAGRRGGGPLAVSPAGTLWTASELLGELDGDSLIARRDLWDPARGIAITAMRFDRDGRLWLADHSGLLVISMPARHGGGTIRRFPTAMLGIAGVITVLMEDDRGRLWIGSAGGGLSRYDGTRFTSFTSGEGLSDDFITALLQDRTGNIWVATHGGLDRLRPRAIRSLTVREGLPDNDVWSVAIEPGGSILVGTRHGGISRIRGGRVTPLRDGRGRMLLHWSGALEPRADGTLFFSAQRPAGTWRLDRGGTLTAWRPPGSSDTAGPAYSFLSDSDGTLWVGSGPQEGTLYRQRGGSTRAYRDPSGRLTEPIWDIARDSAGTIWLAAGALYRVAGDSLERVCETSNPELFGALLADRAGLWMGTGTGSRLSLFRGGKCLTLHGRDMPATDVYSIQKDGQGHLWVAASEGLLQYDESDLERRATDSMAPVTFRLFDRLDGLLSVELNAYGDSPSAVAPDGSLLFASAGGLVVVDPAAIPRNPVPPRPLILEAALNDSSYPVDRPVVAPLGAGKLTFTFTAPLLGLPERLRLQYRLDGKDTGWREAGKQHQVTYAGLGGGDYTFRVRAANEDGVWSASEAQLALQLAAPFTRTWPFYIVLGALLLGSGFGVGAIRNRVIARRERQLERLVEQRTRELAEARNRLEERVEERTAALAQESAARLRVERDLSEAQKMESVGRLAGGVAHDLNNMLTVVLGNADLLRASLERTPHAEEVEQIVSASSRAAHLTSQLLSFARRQVGQPQVLHLDTLVRDLESMLRRLIGEQVTMRLDFAPWLWNIWADRGQLEQVLVNLTMNAHDAMPAGGTLTIEASNVTLSEVEVRDRAGMDAGEYVRLLVRDTGVGMEPQVLAHVFEPFYSTKETGKGTGLGLASCYGIARQWGGHITATSTVGVGTTLELLLPRSLQPIAAEAGESPPTSPPRGTGQRILLVEDQPEVRFLARRLLEAAGYVVTEAGDGEEAIALLELRGVEVDMVLSDVVMPQMNGKALADHLRRTRAGLPVVLMTGYSRGMLSENGLLDPAYRVIGKPFNQTTLLTEVDDALRRTRRG